jgi:hypothetical protein
MTRIGTLAIAGLALSLLLVGPTGATTVTLTEGTFSLWLIDTDIHASGPGITLQGVGPFGFNPQPVAGGLVMSVLQLGGKSGELSTGGTVTVNGVTCQFFSGAVCGTLAFFSPPTADPPADWLPAHAFEAFLSPPVPFVMIGQLDVGPGYDVVGTGTLDRLWCFANVACESSFPGALGSPVYQYHFATVDEPASAALLVIGAGVLGGLMLARRRV